MKTALHKFIEKRLHALGKTARGASIEAGMGPDGIRNIYRGQSKSVRGDNLINLARVLEVSPDELLKAAHPSLKGPQGLGVNDISQNTLRPVVLRGKVAAGVWREHASNGEVPDVTAIPSHPRYPGVEQYALEVEGESVNRVAQNGWMVVCVPYWEARRELTDGDLVHVERRNSAGHYEFTLKRLKSGRDGPELWPESSHPGHQKPTPVANSDGYTVEVIGLVIGVYNPNP